MIDKIQIVLDVLGILSCAILTVYTGEAGYLVATIWAMTAFISHVND